MEQDISRVHFEAVPSLRRLYLSHGNLTFTALATFQQLTTLVLKDIFLSSVYVSMNMPSVAVLFTHSFLPLSALTTLELHDIKPQAILTNDLFPLLLKSLPNLTRLAVSGAPHLSDGALAGIAQHGITLQSLSLNGLRLLTDEGIALLVQSCTALLSLEFPNCTQLTDRTISTIARSLPQLSLLDVSYCLRITPLCLHDLEHLHSLNTLVLSHSPLRNPGLLLLPPP